MEWREKISEEAAAMRRLYSEWHERRMLSISVSLSSLSRTAESFHFRDCRRRRWRRHRVTAENEHFMVIN